MLISRVFVACAAVGLAGGCAWDGPPVAVRVVPPETVPAAPAAEARVATGADAEPAEGAAGAAPEAGDDRATEDRANGEEPAIVEPLPATVVVVGDSLTLSADAEISAALRAMGVRVLAIDGVESRRMASGSSSLPSGLDAIEEIREELGDVEPEIWVLALGTNDVGAQVDPERFRSDLTSTLDAVPSTAPVVWVDVWIRDRADAAVIANGVIRTELDERSTRSGVVDWFANGSVDGVISGDGVHLTELGRATFAEAIASQIRSMYGR